MQSVSKEGVPLFRPPTLTEEEASISSAVHSITLGRLSHKLHSKVLRKSQSLPNLVRRGASSVDVAVASKSFEEPMLGSQEDDIGIPLRQAGLVSPYQPKEILAHFCDGISGGADILLYGSPGDDRQQMSGPLRDEAMLEEALLLFASVSDISFPFGRGSRQAVATVNWQQLVACWRHTEVMKALNLRHPSDHFPARNDDDLSERDLICNSVTSILPKEQEKCDDLVLSGIRFQSHAVAERRMNNLNGFPPRLGDNCIPALASLLTTLGTHPGEIIDGNMILRHRLPSNIAATNASDIHDFVKSNLDCFALLIEDLVAFSSQNEVVLNNGVDVERTLFSVGVKNLDAFVSKSKRKYSGDLLQVKDVLRARIVFPTEGSLVCALLRLRYQESEQVGGGHKITISRVKNLFRSDGTLSGMVRSNLPTGYRHVLVNVRLNGSVVAGTYESGVMSVLLTVCLTII